MPSRVTLLDLPRNAAQLHNPITSNKPTTQQSHQPTAPVPNSTQHLHPPRVIPSEPIAPGRSEHASSHHTRYDKHRPAMAKPSSIPTHYKAELLDRNLQSRYAY